MSALLVVFASILQLALLGSVAAAPADPTAADLQLPVTAYAGVEEVVVRAIAVDDPAVPDAAAAPEVLVLRRSRQTSAANYRYGIGGERPGELRVRIDVFRDETTATEAFRGRHMPEMMALTTPLAVGDEGFRYADEYAGFRVGPAVVEIRAKGAAGHLADFAAAYAAFVAERLREASAPQPPAPGHATPPAETPSPLPSPRRSSGA